MNIFNGLYYYAISYDHSIKVDDHNDYSVVSTDSLKTHTEKIVPQHDLYPKIEVFIIEDGERDKDISICPPHREFTPDTSSTLDICISPENLETDINLYPEEITQETTQEMTKETIKIDKMFENKTVEEIIKYYENKMKTEKSEIDEIINNMELIDCKCNFIIFLFVFYIFLANSLNNA